jgi:hypothetical protein
VLLSHVHSNWTPFIEAYLVERGTVHGIGPETVSTTGSREGQFDAIRFPDATVEQIQKHLDLFEDGKKGQQLIAAMHF